MWSTAETTERPLFKMGLMKLRVDMSLNVSAGHLTRAAILKWTNQTVYVCGPLVKVLKDYVKVRRKPRERMIINGSSPCLSTSCAEPACFGIPCV